MQIMDLYLAKHNLNPNPNTLFLLIYYKVTNITIHDVLE